MAGEVLVKIKAEKATEICEKVTLDKPARKRLDPEVSPAGFLDRLKEDGAHSDAIRFLAFALPKREAVWWACLCTRSTLQADTEQIQLDALQAAEAWVYKPTEENRRAALTIGEKAGSSTGPSMAALAAGWSGGSLAPPDGPVVAPGDNLTPTAVSVAIFEAVLAAGRDAPAQFPLFLARGIDIAAGGTGRLNPGPS